MSSPPEPREFGRRAMDRYDTPPHYVRALLDHIGQPRGLVYEPCVGRGHITRLLTKARGIITNDLDRRVTADTHYNAARAKAFGTLGIAWCITNPPFSREVEILSQALLFHKNVAFLARLSFLEPCEDRRDFWERYASTCHVIVLPRYSFRRNDDGKRATDSLTCCWLVWRTDPKTQRKVQSGLSVSMRRPRVKREVG